MSPILDLLICQTKELSELLAALIVLDLDRLFSHYLETILLERLNARAPIATHGICGI